MKISRITHKTQSNALAIEFDSQSAELSCEYLRAFMPTESDGPRKISPHLKGVQIAWLDLVGKHGFRIMFDDGQQAVFSPEYVQWLIENFNTNWQEYLAALESQNKSREAKIDIVNLS